MTDAARGSNGLARGSDGFLLAVVVSLGILAARVMPGNGLAVAVSMAMAIGVALVVYRTTTHAAGEPQGESPASSYRTVGPEPRSSVYRSVIAVHALGALIGMVLVHAILQQVFIAQLSWLREDPRQLVNDFVGVFGILTVIWACARRPPLLWPIVLGVLLVGAYALTSSHWHFDRSPMPGAFGSSRPMSVQSFVLVQVAGASACVALLRAHGRTATQRAAAAPALPPKSLAFERDGVDGVLVLTVIIVGVALLLYR